MNNEQDLDIQMTSRHRVYQSRQYEQDGYKPRTHPGRHYRRLVVMATLSFICIYLLMYAMVNTSGNLFFSLNQFYMACLMTLAIVIIEMVVMNRMYMNKKLNSAIIGISAVLLMLFFVFIRQQEAVGDRQFLKSMIPHQAGAILMCEGADIKDPDVKELSRTIMVSQRAQIDAMQSKLKELENKKDW